MKKVFVVTGTELGWDCLVGVYDAEIVSYSQLEKRYPSTEYVISDTTIETTVDTE